MSSITSVKGCGRNVLMPRTGGSGAVELRVGQDGRAGYSGVQLCSSLWACPCCSARIREERSQMIEQAGLQHLRNGGALYFLTLTMPHDGNDQLGDTKEQLLDADGEPVLRPPAKNAPLNAKWVPVRRTTHKGLLTTVLDSWRYVQQSREYRECKIRHGLRFVRAVEITYNPPALGGGGWHPHMHVLLFTDGPLTVDERADLLGKIEGRWGQAVVKAGYRLPAGDGIGVNLRDVDASHNAAGLLAYLAKVQDNYGTSWGVGTEMARGDLKTGRRAASLTPFDLAAQAAAGNGWALQLWHEYETATRGRKAIHWSDDLLELLDAPADDAVLEVDDQAVTVLVLTPENWRQVCRRRWLSRLLDLAEQHDYEGLDVLVARARAGP